MPNQNQITISEINSSIGVNTPIFDKKLWDVVIPIQVIAHDRILQSPIVEVMSSSPLDNGGVYQDVVFTRHLDGNWEEIQSKTAPSVSGISQLRDSCMAVYRAKSWGQEEIAIDMVGANLLKTVEAATTQWWSDQYQKYILNLLKGVFGGALKSTHQLNLSTNTMSWGTIAAATSLLGDESRKLATIVMHSAQLNNLKQSGLVKYYNASELGYDIWTKGSIPTINGLWIVETDEVPVEQDGSTTIYHSYIGGQGAIQFRNISFDNKYHWDALATGTEYFIQRAKVMARVPGVRFLRENASDSMNFKDIDVANPLCWQKIAQRDKDIPLVELITTAEPLTVTN